MSFSICAVFKFILLHNCTVFNLMCVESFNKMLFSPPTSDITSHGYVHDAQPPHAWCPPRSGVLNTGWCDTSTCLRLSLTVQDVILLGNDITCHLFRCRTAQTRAMQINTLNIITGMHYDEVNMGHRFCRVMFLSSVMVSSVDTVVQTFHVNKNVCLLRLPAQVDQLLIKQRVELIEGMFLQQCECGGH